MRELVAILGRLAVESVQASGRRALNAVRDVRCWVACDRHSHEALERRARVAEDRLAASELHDRAVRGELEKTRNELARERARKAVS